MYGHALDVRHTLEEKSEFDETLAMTLTVEDENVKYANSAINSPQKHNLKTENILKFFRSLDHYV